MDDSTVDIFTEADRRFFHLNSRSRHLSRVPATNIPFISTSPQLFTVETSIPLTTKLPASPSSD